jgi:hypothetical protein
MQEPLEAILVNLHEIGAVLESLVIVERDEPYLHEQQTGEAQQTR